MTLKIFLCYSLLDERVFQISELKKKLKDIFGIECYFSLQDNIKESYNIQGEIRNLLIESDKILLFCSPHISNNDNIDYIVNSAINLNKNFIIIYIKSSHIPKSLRLKKSIEFDIFEIENTLERILGIITINISGDLPEHRDSLPSIKDSANSIIFDANDVGYWVTKANESFEHGKILESELYFKKAFKLDPKNPSLLVALGTIYFEKRKYDLSEQYLRQALVINPNYGPAWRILSMLMIESKNEDTDSESYFQKAIDLDPSNGRAWHNMGVYHHKIQHNFDEAEKCYLKAIELQPNHPVSWNNLGLLYDELKNNIAIAEKHYRKAIELDDRFAPAFANLGILYHLKKDNYKEGKLFLEKAIQIDRTYGSAYFYLGIIADEKEGNFDNAHNFYRQALNMEPSNRDYLRHIIDIKKKMNSKLKI